MQGMNRESLLQNQTRRRGGVGSGLSAVAALLACVGTVQAQATWAGSVREPVDEVERQTLAGMTDAPVTVPPAAAAPDAAPAGAQVLFDDDTPKAGVTVSDYMTVDIFVNNEDLANVLQMLSLQSRRNIIASSRVSASVTANLYGVTLKEALDAILHVNGYGYVEKGNFIYVYTSEELAKIEAATINLVTRVVHLNYLSANDAAEFVTPLLSERGQIKTNGDAGQFSLPADNPTGGEDFANSATMVIYDFPDHVDQIEKLITQLDTRPSQVLVEATILQTSLNEANAFGVDFSILANTDFLPFFNLGGPLGSALALGQVSDNKVAPPDNRSTAVNSTPGNFAGPANFRAAIIHDDIAFFIRALDQVSDVKILSNPKVLALNRQPARVLVGRKLGYLSTTSTETSTTQSVQFLDTGTQLTFRPFIAKDGMVRMELKPRVSEGVIREATDVTGAAVTIPDEITQEITTNVMVRDGQTIVLGGLFKETTKLSRSQVPILGDIPILNLAFRGHDDNIDRAEIIFMIKPTIVNDKMLVEQGERGQQYVERVRAGTRQALLPFSRDRQTTQLNVEAEKLAADGQRDKAMHALRRSLELNPNQPDALQLRERLFNEKSFWPSRSILERVVNDEIEKSYSWDSRPLQPADPTIGSAQAKASTPVATESSVTVQTASDGSLVEIDGAMVISDDDAAMIETSMNPASDVDPSVVSWDAPIGFEDGQDAALTMTPVQPRSNEATSPAPEQSAQIVDLQDNVPVTPVATQSEPVASFESQEIPRFPLIAGLPWVVWFGQPWTPQAGPAVTESVETRSVYRMFKRDDQQMTEVDTGSED